MWNRSCAAAVLSAAGLAALLPGPAMAVDRRVELLRHAARKGRLAPAGGRGRVRGGGAAATITPPGEAASGNSTNPLSKSSKSRTSSSKTAKSSKSSSGSSRTSKDSRDVDFDVVCPIRQDDTSGEPRRVKPLGRPNLAGATGLADAMLARDKAPRKFAGLGRKPLRKNTFAKRSECDAVDEDPPAEARRALQEFIPQIVGGQDVDPPRKFGFFAKWGGCAGSLIAPNLVLTAAHCNPLEVDTVTLGMHKVDVERDVAEFGFVEHIPIARRLIHPCYDAFSDDFDFMILELESSSEMYSDRVVELDDPADPVELDDGKPLTVMGFGLLFSSLFPITPNVMQEVSVPFDSGCGMYPPDSITDRMLCAGIAGADACQGDSGGAIVDPDTGKLIGVVSVGQGCGLTGFPGIYARVSSVFDWITAHIDELGSDTLTASLSSAECADGTPGWYNTSDPQFNCIFFAEFPEACTDRDALPNGGLTANEACCTCAALSTDLYLDPFPDRSDTSADFGVAFQYDGAYQAAPHGFVQPTVTSGTVLLPDEAVFYEFNLVDVAAFTAILPPEGVLFPFELDLDLFLLDPNGELFQFSINDGTNELIEIGRPEDGIWTLIVDGFITFTETTRRPADFDLYTWITPLAPGGSLTVDSAPVSATFGRTESISISWPSIAPEEWPRGAISHTARGVIQEITVVRFDSPLSPKIPSIDVPLFEEGSGESGTLQFDVTFGYTGGYTAAAHGLVSPIVVSDEVILGRWTVHEFVLSGLALFQAITSQDFLDPSDSDTDLDLYLVSPLGQLVASSAIDGSDELVEVDFPMDGTWSVYVYAFDVPSGSSSTGYDLLTWSVSATPGGNLNVDSAPSSATSGTTGTVQVSWSGATAVAGPEAMYTGVISHTNEDDGSIVLTEIVIDNWATLS